MAWERKNLNRAGRLEFWTTGAKGEASPRAAFLRPAISDSEWDTVERHGGLNVVMEKIAQLEQETPASTEAGMLDHFRLWGSRRCRQMGVTLLDGEGDIRG